MRIFVTLLLSLVFHQHVLAEPIPVEWSEQELNVTQQGSDGEGKIVGDGVTAAPPVTATVPPHGFGDSEDEDDEETLDTNTGDEAANETPDDTDSIDDSDLNSMNVSGVDELLHGQYDNDDSHGDDEDDDDYYDNDVDCDDSDDDGDLNRSVERRCRRDRREMMNLRPEPRLLQATYRYHGDGGNHNERRRHRRHRRRHHHQRRYRFVNYPHGNGHRRRRYYRQ
ncbi:unnamed protein product [Trichobilharzia szidati]|nr:unnamed protein product [Trichobilharzia szidati]